MGSVRVYAYTGGTSLDVDDWFAALKNGHTFVSNGPMIDFKVDDAIPGDTLNVEEGQSMHVYARAWADPEDFRPYRLEIIQNGDVIHSVEQTNAAQTELIVDFNLTVDKGSWVAAHVADAPGSTFRERAEAHTTPIYLERDGLRFWKRNEAVALIRERLADLNEVEEMIQNAHLTLDTGSNYLNTTYSTWELNYRCERIIATEDLLRDRIQEAQDIYDDLLEIYQQENRVNAPFSFTEDFSGGALPVNMELTTHWAHPSLYGGSLTEHVDFGSNNAHWEEMSHYRQYIRTKRSDYSRVDFVFEADVSLNIDANYGEVLYGMGIVTGTLDRGHPGHPGIGAMESKHSTRRYKIISTADNDDGLQDSSWNNFSNANRRPNKEDPFRVRMEWNATAKTATMSIDQNYNGSTFIADHSFVISSNEVAGADGLVDGMFDAYNSHLFIGGGNGVTIDNISVETGLSFFEEWVIGYGLDPGGSGAQLEDPDSDGLDNLAEYALGGNPKDGNATTYSPILGVAAAGGGSNVVEYVYNRRPNAASLGLTYGLNTSSNLTNAWNNVGTAYETGSADIDPYFESVTNSIPVIESEGFIQLRISED
ncbi:MAG: hypothetical protein DRP64_19995 [Verrucomicrobia bacterium]|nr:MAG: hypothetical protein DRP64_19995 [Verrucomicrobiota bacterium]